MKKFAIIPEKFSAVRVVGCLPNLLKSGIDYLYLRGMTDVDEISGLVGELNKTDIVPVLPYKTLPESQQLVYGVHYKSTEIVHVAEKQSGCAILLTASAHDVNTAKHLLENGVDFVYISPVFRPFSKKDDTRKLFSTDRIISLTSEFGERVVLLGGLTGYRIDNLKENIKNDFSVAGITLFFNNP